MPKKIGVIAEDKSDVKVVELLLQKYMAKNLFSIKSFVGGGCGKLKQKCASWSRLLIDQGCDHVFVFHDLDSIDRKAEVKLRALLNLKLPVIEYPQSLIVIPIEELEAWLLSDSDAIRQVFDLPKTPNQIHDCEEIASPKEYLEDVVWTIGKKRYVNTIHNSKIASLISLANLTRCRSYLPFHNYVCEVDWH